MKNKRQKLSALLMFGLGLTTIQAQTLLNMKQSSGTNTAYTLTTVRKITFPVSGNMYVTKTTGVVENYSLNTVRYYKFSDVGTGIADAYINNATIKLYPNPVVDVLNIQLPQFLIQEGVVTIYSIDGKVVCDQKLSQTVLDYRVNVSQLQKGIYLCRINNGSAIVTTKFIKQ